MTVVAPVRSRFFLSIGSSLVMVAGMLFGATAAAADSVQVQSYQRASQTANCDNPPESMSEWRASWANPSDPISGPTWHPSWERWANNGSGGWTCTRSITWARSPLVEVSSDASCDVRLTYSVGDIGPGCGTIFYVDMARAAGSQYWEVGSDLGTAQWGCVGNDKIKGTGTDIGDGATNTEKITTGCVTTGIAADIASAPAGGYRDWFLPSKDELNQLCKYARNQSTSPADQAVTCNNTGTLRGGFASDWYWSSSQVPKDDKTYAQIQRFDVGTQTGGNKSESWNVRPIRAF